MSQEAKEKEKKHKAANAEEGGVSIDELTLKAQNLQAEKRMEEEARNRMQLERVSCPEFKTASVRPTKTFLAEPAATGRRDCSLNLAANMLEQRNIPGCRFFPVVAICAGQDSVVLGHHQEGAGQLQSGAAQQGQGDRRPARQASSGDQGGAGSNKASIEVWGCP